MRVTPFIMFDSLVNDFRRNFTSIYRVQQQISSGKRINTPSDNVIGMSKVLDYKVSINMNERYLGNIDEAMSQLSVAEGTMKSVGDTLTRLKELAMEGASDSVDASQKSAIKEEVAVLTQHLIGLANTTFRERYIFSGFKSDMPTYVSGTGLITDTGEIRIKIDDGDNIAVNVPGIEALSFALGAPETIRLDDGTYVHYVTGTMLKGNDITAPGTDETIQFTVAGRLGTQTINVNVSSTDTQADIAANLMSGINAVKDLTGVEARDGGGGTAVDIFDPEGGDITISGLDVNESAWSGLSDGTTPAAGRTTYVEVRDANDNAEILSFSFGNFVEMAEHLSSALENGDSLKIKVLLEAIDKSIDQAIDVRAEIGTRQSSLDDYRNRIEDSNLMLKSNLSNIEDTDMAEAISELAKLEVALEAMRQAGSSIISQSLMDYLK